MTICYPNIPQVLVQQIKANCPVFNNMVGIASSPAAIQKVLSSNLALPAAFIMPISSTAEPNEYMNDYFQKISETYGVMVILDNQGNTSGQTALINIGSIKWNLIAAVANFNPDPTRATKGLTFDGHQLVAFDAKYTWYSFEYYWEYQITPPEVWHNQGVDITDIQFTTPIGNTTFVIDTAFAQLQAWIAEAGNAQDTCFASIT